MFQLLMLLAFAYAQDNYGSYPAYAWAVAFGVLNVLMMVALGGHLLAALVMGVVLTVYAWAYFLVLRRVGDNLGLWILVCLVGLVAPFLLVM